MQKKFAYINKKQYFCTTNQILFNMKRLFLAVVVSVTTFSIAHSATGITLDAELKAALPSGAFFLPAPPEVGSLIWLDDSTKYFQYKELSRKIDETKQERWDSAWAAMNEQYYFALYRLAADSVMNAPFIDVSWTRTAPGKYTVTNARNTTDFPEINALERMCEEMKEQGTSKLWRTRPRPYKYFGTWYKTQKYAIDRTDATSYPSGHGYFAGLFGMCMMYIDPANALAIKKMMDEWCDCRLLLGAHWKTDLDAGKQLGAITFAIAMNHEQFRSQVLAAKKELEDYRAAHAGSGNTTTDNNLVPVPDPSNNKVVKNGQVLILNEGKAYNAAGLEVKNNYGL